MIEYGLGIDAGGTYTDAVILHFPSQQVLAKGKALTTKDDLSRGIAAVLGKLPADLRAQVQLVALSTTLATNAIVEGKGYQVGAILLGFNKYSAAKVDHTPTRTVGGRMGVTGQEMEPLDQAGLRDAVRDLLETEQVDALAISGMMSVRNPAHEHQAREIVASMTEKPVVCGHAMSMELDGIKRTMTAVLNARLLPIIDELILHVKTVLARVGIQAPLVVVRGDGTLLNEAMARLNPVETILSGPAASVQGAQFLSGIQEGLVVDIGGTTSDIARITGGMPVMAAQGAHVGAWSTHVRAVDMETVGLGGDSAVSVLSLGEMLIGPRRAIPLCYLAAEYPAMLPELRRLAASPTPTRLIQPIEFFLRVREGGVSALTAGEQRVLAALADGPLSRQQIAARVDAVDALLVPVDTLETLGYIQRATLTPTDVLHYRELFGAWNREAAILGLTLFAERLGCGIEEVATRVLDGVTRKLTFHLLHRLLRGKREQSDALNRLIAEVIDRRTCDIGLELTTAYAHPLVGIGAPAEALAPTSAAYLQCQMVIPPHAEVANAVGAITGMQVVQVEVIIAPTNEAYVAYSPMMRREFAELPQAKAWAMTHADALLDEKIADAATDGLTFHRELQEVDYSPNTPMGTVFIEYRIRAIAMAKPEFTAVVC